MKKKNLKKLDELVKVLPPIYKTVNELDVISGKELKKKFPPDYPKELSDQIRDTYTYTLTKKAKVLVNHAKELKKVFKKGGMKEVYKYNDRVLKTFSEQKPPHVPATTMSTKNK